MDRITRLKVNFINLQLKIFIQKNEQIQGYTL